MPVMETYAPGTFCWADLGTPDAAAAKRFYTALFGWSADDRPIGPDASYTMLTVDGRAVAALYALEPAHSGAPPHWLSYISVASASDLAKRAKELGAAVLMDPFDVLDVGRMALVQDPTVYEQLVTILGGVGRSRVLRALVRFAISKEENKTARHLDPPPGRQQGKR